MRGRCPGHTNPKRERGLRGISYGVVRRFRGESDWREPDDVHRLHPEGMSAISRELSEATPPKEVEEMAVAS